MIVTYNTRELTLACLARVAEATAGLAADVWVVDNASGDGTAAAVADRFPAVHLIVNDENVGFGAANNRAMARARGDYLLLLNSDAFPEPGAVAALVAFLDAHPAVGFAGPRLLNADGTVQHSLQSYSTPAQIVMANLGLLRLRDAVARSTEADEVRSLARGRRFFKGACFILRRAVFDHVGGFDERIYLYGEEADWEYRMVKAGYEPAFVESAVVTHLGGESGAGRWLELSLRVVWGADYFVLKHFGRPALVLARSSTVLWCLRKLLVNRCRRTFGAARDGHAVPLYLQLLRSAFQSPNAKVRRPPPPTAA